MAATEPDSITPEEFAILVRRAGLDLSPEEMENLRPMYQQLAAQIAMLHDPGLSLEEPWVSSAATGFQR